MTADGFGRASPVLLRCLAWGAFLLALGALLVDRFARDSQPVVFVSPEGSDWNTGSDEAAPVATLARALELVSPSGTVTLLPGVYMERSHITKGGTPGTPLVVQAKVPGSVLLTWQEPADLGRTLQWESIPSGPGGPNLYQTQLTRPVYRLRSGGEDLFRVTWGGLDSLNQIVSLPGAMGAFHYESGKLTVYLPNGRHPRDSELVFHREVPRPREWGEFRSANMWIEADHVEIRGIRFDMGIGSSIQIWDANDIEISDCSFQGATHGVIGGRTPEKSTNIVLERSLYHNYPQHLWRRQWLGWQQIYAYYSSSSLFSGSGPGIRIRDCAAVHCGDGIQVSSRANAPADSAIVEDSIIAHFTDDAVEFDGPAANIHFRRNLVFDGHVGLGISPVEKGPCTISENVFLHPHAAVAGAHFKLIEYLKDQHIRNVDVRNNVFIGNYLAWIGRIPISDVSIRDNLIAYQRLGNSTWPEGVRAVDNTIVELPEHQEEFSARQIADVLKEHLPESFPGAAKVVDARLQHGYGPGWWNWSEHAATAELDSQITSLRKERGAAENSRPQQTP